MKSIVTGNCPFWGISLLVRRIYTCIILLGQQFGYSGEKERLVSKETVILRRCRSEILKFGIKDVNKSRISTVRTERS